MGQHELAEEFVGSNQASATRNYSAAIGFRTPCNHPNWQSAAATWEAPQAIQRLTD